MTYTQNNNYVSVPADVRSICMQDIGIGDTWQLFSIADNEYICVIKTPLHGYKTVRVYRDTSMSRYWHIVRENGLSDVSTVITNEYYMCSNVGQGVYIENPHAQDISTWGIVIITCVVLLSVVFKGVFTRCVNIRK